MRGRVFLIAEVTSPAPVASVAFLLDGQPINGSDIEAAMGTTRDPAKSKEMWTSWHDNVGRPMRADYTHMVDIANQGAKELGYADTGAMWRSQYDMSPEEFSAMYERLWSEVKPLYNQLHCYTRTKLNQKYGNAVQPASGLIARSGRPRILRLSFWNFISSSV